MKKNILVLRQQCAVAQLFVEAVDIAQEDRTRILEELRGYTIISQDAKTIWAYKTDRFDVLKDELSELMKKGWVWG